MSPTRRVWWSAVALTVLLHVVLVLTAWWRLPRAEAAAAPLAPLQLSFARTEPASDQLRQYVEQPERAQDDAAPDDARLLSNVDAAAQDEAAGEVSDVPRQEGEFEFPSVAMEAAPDRPPQSATEQAELRAQVDPLGELKLPEPRERHSVSGLLREGDGQDLFTQPDAQRLDGNVDLLGQVQLSTVAWEFAPWLQRFRAQLLRNWNAPYAFHMGLIHGQQRIRIEVGRDGRLLAMTLLDSEGHDSLRAASLAAFRAAAPYAPLPDHFPDESLFMTWVLIYPERSR